uniref:Uncharacterized protein n=1 Tax=Knipowitschia caucasica TaxID=637954 RepID=A0AAV2J0V5_KNICA
MQKPQGLGQVVCRADRRASVSSRLFEQTQCIMGPYHLFPNSTQTPSRQIDVGGAEEAGVVLVVLSSLKDLDK